MPKKKRVRKNKKKSARPRKAAHRQKTASKRKPARRKKPGTRAAVLEVLEIDVVRGMETPLEIEEAETSTEETSDDEPFPPEYGGSK
jgi:hypothetical protein